jgi:peptide methionine sulfoxide reductase MsrA
MNPTHGQGMNPPAVPLQYLLDRLRIRPWVGTSFTTEILDGPTAYYADDYHQLYLHKNPGGYCGINGTGVNCPIGTGA